MRASGKFTIDQMRTINETRMHAVWKLGRLLAKVDRKRGGSKDRPGILKAFLVKLELNKDRAQERESIGAMKDVDGCLLGTGSPCDLHGTCAHEPTQRGEAPDAGQKRTHVRRVSGKNRLTVAEQ